MFIQSLYLVFQLHDLMCAHLSAKFSEQYALILHSGVYLNAYVYGGGGGGGS